MIGIWMDGWVDMSWFVASLCFQSHKEIFPVSLLLFEFSPAVLPVGNGVEVV